MHVKLNQPSGALTDSMKMFKLGLEGGRPDSGEIGAQPEWFYKGDGSSIVAPYSPIPVPAFALDGGEEPELVGIYLIGPNRQPYRIGFALGNEFSDHVTERQNYLWLAHSKLRYSSFGPELRLGEMPQALEGVSRVLRNGKPIWKSPFSLVKRTCVTRLPTSSITISSTRSSVVRVTCIFTSSALRP